MSTAKSELKRKKRMDQKGTCAISEETLQKRPALYDLDTTTDEGNIKNFINMDYDELQVVDPVVHLAKHDNLVERSNIMTTLKSMIDDRNHLMRGWIKLNNQRLAYERRVDQLNPETLEWITEKVREFALLLQARTQAVNKMMRVIYKQNPTAKAAKTVKGVGDITVAYCVVYLNPFEARHASSYWKYVGFHTASMDRYQKGQKGGGNKNLRTALFNMATVQLKTNGPYRAIYDNVKLRLSMSENNVRTYNGNRQVVTKAWKDVSAGHRHGAAMRAMMKHFLADYWFVDRTLNGLDTSPCYAEAMLGGTHRTIMPEERGWVY